jgi:mono/diheme cytochrome c family protein
MLGNLLGLLVLVLLTALLVWLSLRAWRARSRIVRWLGGPLSSLLALLFLLVTGITAVGVFKIYVPSRLPAVNAQIQSSPEQIARGQHLAQVVCADCHTENGTLPLSGSTKDTGGEFGLPLGSIYPANLTPGGDLKDWSDADIFRAIRYNRSTASSCSRRARTSRSRWW